MAIPGPAPTLHTEELLARAEANQEARRAADAEQLVIARQWALAHAVSPADVARDGVSHTREIGAIRMRVTEYAAAELGVVFNIHALAAQKLMADALDLPVRLPHAWQVLQSGGLPAWVARKLTTLTRDLTPDKARLVDTQLADHYESLPTGRLLAAAEGRVAAADPVTLDQRAEQARQSHDVHTSEPVEGTATIYARMDAAAATRLDHTCNRIADLLEQSETNGETRSTRGQLRAQALGLLADPQAALDLLQGRDPRRGNATLYVHLTPALLNGASFHATKTSTGSSAKAGVGVARAEDLGAQTKTMLARLLGHDHITVKPVIDLNDQPPPADSYEIPAALAERVHLTKPADIYPWAESVSRRTDIDHTDPWPQGTTSIDNLGKLTRRHHRIKTFAQGWRVIQLPGHRYLWRTPHRRIVAVDRAGTHPHHLELTWSDLAAAGR